MLIMIRLLILWVKGCRSFRNRRSHRGCGRSVPATSILETVISMTILLTILTLSFATLDRINKTVNPVSLYKAYLATNEVLIRDDLLLGELEEYEVDSYLVKKTISLQGNDMYLVELSVVNGHGNKIYDRKIFKSIAIDL